MKIEQGMILEVDIESITDDGMGVSKISVDGRDFVIFVIDAITGDRVRVKLLQKKKNYAIARVIKLLEISPKSVVPFDKYFGKSGGCSISRMEYSHQLSEKSRAVLDAISRIGGFDLAHVQCEDIVGMQEPFYYRNKSIYPSGINGFGEVDFGYYKPRSHDIAFEHGGILDNPINVLLTEEVKNWANTHKISVYDEVKHEGILRNLIIRNANSGDIMIAIGANCEELPFGRELVQELLNLDLSRADKFGGIQEDGEISKGVLLQKKPRIVSILHNVQKHKGNAVISNRSNLLYGEQEMKDSIGDLEFKLSLASFFQVNPVQTLKLYRGALEYADLSGDENVWDLYCGAGTISLFLARNCKFVRGNEYVEVAVKNAFENARLNGIDNVDFEAGATEEIIPNWLHKYESPDVVVLDPPRKGAERAVLDAILSVSPQKIVYVSCNPSTLARDLKILCADGNYQLIKLRPYDLFPHTMHVECIALTQRVKS